MSPVKVGIVGAGFTGTALAALLQRLTPFPIHVTLFDSSGQWGAGPAYSTPFSYHLLNVRAKEMSVFEDDPLHFVRWLKAHPQLMTPTDEALPIELQFLPRALYRTYLQSLLQTLALEQDDRDVVDLIPAEAGVTVVLADGKTCVMDKVILAMGAPSPAEFAFPVHHSIQEIAYPWDYEAQANVQEDAAVLIVGTGLSMVDVVLTLHQRGHRGKIYAVSRRGLLPLPHLFQPPATTLPDLPASITQAATLRSVMRQLHAYCDALVAQGKHWQPAIDMFRLHIPAIWQRLTLREQKQFIRRALPYWNIHRHRVPVSVSTLLHDMIEAQQLQIIRGQVVATGGGVSYIKVHPSQQTSVLPTHSLINCMGPNNCINNDQKPLIQSLLKRNIAALDPLQLGLVVDSFGALINSAGQRSAQCYAVGALTRGATWELTAVPQIRQQVFQVVQHLLCHLAQGKGKHGVNCHPTSF